MNMVLVYIFFFPHIATDAFQGFANKIQHP